MPFELCRVAHRRFIFQHWFMPADRHGRWKKLHKFQMTSVYASQPKTYFERAQIITVFDALDEEIKPTSLRLRLGKGARERGFRSGCGFRFQWTGVLITFRMS